MKNKELLLNEFKDNYKCNFVCKRPFELVELDLEGNVYLCFPRCNDLSYKIGNLYEKSFEEMSKSEKAIIFKEDILSSEYKYCSFENCQAPNINIHLTEFNKNELLDITYPKELRLHIDNICNIKCFMCRNEYITKFPKENEFKEIIIPRIVSMCKNAEIIFMNGQGETFYSPLAKELILAITKTYPNIKFDFCTNGLNLNEKYIEEYNLRGKIKSISVSLHAINKSTYDKILIGSNYKIVMKNLEYIRKLHDEKEIENVTLNFVVTSHNYREMIKFQEYATEHNFTSFYSALVDTNVLGKTYTDIALKNKKSLDYKKFCKIIINEIFDNSNCIFDNQLQELRTSLKEKEKTKTNFIMKLFKIHR